MPSPLYSSTSSSINFKTKYTPLISQDENTSFSPKVRKFNSSHFLLRSRNKLLTSGLFFLLLLTVSLLLSGIVHFKFNFHSGSFPLWSPSFEFFCSWPLANNLTGSPISSVCSAVEYQQLLAENPDLIILEPDYLAHVHLMKKAFDSFNRDNQHLSAGKIKEDWDNFRWRFNLPENFSHQKNSLTVGVFPSVSRLKNKVEIASRLKLGDFSLVETVSGPLHHQKQKQGNQNSTLHLFFRQNSSSIALHLHIVVLHPIQEFFWIGSIPEDVVARLTNKSLDENYRFRLHFGLHEHALDRFAPTLHWNLKFYPKIIVPDDIPHFLSQLPTSRYLYCPRERGFAWFAATNRTINQAKEAESVIAFREMKALARLLQIEVFISCGTLLGWYRQCHVTPYTSDTDFGTWSKYLGGRDLGPDFEKALKTLGTRLRLYQRFGEPTATMEYSFVEGSEKVDLFVLYPNGTHLLAPYHIPTSHQYGYNVYPPYSLCSVAFLGVKLLSPCDPEAIIVAEYGPNWRKPDDDYSYISSPKNTVPLMTYNFSGIQHEYY